MKDDYEIIEQIAADLYVELGIPFQQAMRIAPSLVEIYRGMTDETLTADSPSEHG